MFKHESGGRLHRINAASGEVIRCAREMAAELRHLPMTMRPTVTEPWPDDDVILYDGVCLFCSHWIHFVAARDNGRFRFTAIQSGYGRRLAGHYGVDPTAPHTNVVIHRGIAHFKSDGALTVLSLLPGWGWVRMLRALPGGLRDPIYDLIAETRYRIFGRSDLCMVPDAAMRARLME